MPKHDLRICLAALMAALASTVLSAAPMPVKLVRSQQDVMSTHDDQSRTLLPGANIEAGTRVRTAPAGRAELSLLGAPSMWLSADTEVQLHDADAGVLKARLTRGTASIDTRALKGGKARDVRVNLGELRLRVASAQAWIEQSDAASQVCLLAGAIDVQVLDRAHRLDLPGQCLRRSGITSQWSMVPRELLGERVAMTEVVDPGAVAAPVVQVARPAEPITPTVPQVVRAPAVSPPAPQPAPSPPAVVVVVPPPVAPVLPPPEVVVAPTPAATIPPPPEMVAVAPPAAPVPPPPPPAAAIAAPPAAPVLSPPVAVLPPPAPLAPRPAPVAETIAADPEKPPIIASIIAPPAGPLVADTLPDRVIAAVRATPMVLVDNPVPEPFAPPAVVPRLEPVTSSELPAAIPAQRQETVVVGDGDSLPASEPVMQAPIQKLVAAPAPASAAPVEVPRQETVVVGDGDMLLASEPALRAPLHVPEPVSPPDQEPVQTLVAAPAPPPEPEPAAPVDAPVQEVALAATANSLETPVVEAPLPDDGRRWSVVLASMGERAAADQEAERFRGLGFEAVAREYRNGARHGFRVGIGRFASREEADLALTALKSEHPQLAAWLARY